MPTISMFYGILVLMYFRDNRRHNLPHIHVRYQGEEAVISIGDGEIFDGTLPPKQLKMVQAWIEIHKDDCSWTGNWLSTATSLSGLRHFSEIANVE